jgi:hypothetical protein
MGEEGEVAPGYYAYGTTEGEGERNEQKERHGKGTAYFANGDRCGGALLPAHARASQLPAATAARCVALTLDR